jgi:hypothetical protein
MVSGGLGAADDFGDGWRGSRRGVGLSLRDFRESADGGALTAAMLQILFTVLIALQFLVVVLHDWLNIPGWTHGRQVQAALGRNKMLIGTLISAIFPGVAVAFALYYWEKPKPGFALDYWVIYCAVTVASAIASWWIPYIRGTDEKTKLLYSQMYAGTRNVLPPRGDNPRPNVLHLYFHALFLINLALAIALRFGIK